ncbi:MFS transporter [Aquirufa sp. Wall-65K1]
MKTTMLQNEVSEGFDEKKLRKVIAASSVGTLIEWYDFYIFGSLSVIIATKFFPSDNPTAAFLSTLATFAAGFVVRPFGALFFGRLGDLLGRKYTFLVTLLIMGFSTFAIGLIPSYSSIGFLAPILVLTLRLLQGLALGGEYGGAATYVAEHAEPNKRGLRTAWIQTTASLGLFISLLVILATKKSMSLEAFNDWGWRIPFLISIVMVGISYFIRKNMDESPLFAQAKEEGKIVANPLKESFGKKLNFKFVLLALFGATMGQGVVWYTGQFYALSFLQKVANIEFEQSNYIIAISLAAGTGFFIFFGWLSDKIGRKGIMLAGMLLAICTYRPIYQAMYELADVNLKTEKPNSRQVRADYHMIDASVNLSKVTRTIYSYTDGTQLLEEKTEKVSHIPSVQREKAVLKKTVHVGQHAFWMLILLVFIQVIYVTMVYGPIAAFLVEMFPTAIRYTSMSLPYHIGNGIFGGLLPAVATYLAAKANSANEVAMAAGQAIPYDKPYLEGLWYPIIIGGVCFVIGLLYINGKDREIND